MIDIEHWKKRAERYYDDLPYHNFKHALQVLKNAEELIKRCEKYEVPVKADIVRLAALFHDAGYGDESEEVKEVHSAKIAQKELFKNIPDDDVMKVAEAILATHMNAIPVSVEDKIVRAADIRLLAKDYDVFKRENELVYHEHELLTGEHLSDEEWKARTEKILKKLLQEPIRITPEFNEDDFQKKALMNLDMFLKS